MSLRAAIPCADAVRDARDPRRAGARPADRRGGAADLPGLDLQAGRRRRAARRLRVLAARPTRPGPRSRSAWPRSRAASRASRSPPGWPPRTPCCARSAGPATTPSSPTTRTAAPTGCSRKVAEPWGLSTLADRPGRPRRRARRGAARPDQGDLGRDADQPAARHRRHRRARPRSPTPRARCSSSTTPSRRPTCSSPLALGADVVVHSTTKYLGGHSDVVGGALVSRTPARGVRRSGRADRLPPERDRRRRRPVRRVAGAARAQDAGRADGPALRQRGAGRRAFLVEHPRGDPGALPGPARPPGPRDRGPADEAASAAWCRFRLRGRSRSALGVCKRAEVFTLGESLGGVESLIEHPGRMTHASVAGIALEVPDDLIRLSVGIEDVDDLIADLDLRAVLSRPFPDEPGALRRLRVDVHQGGAGRVHRRRAGRDGEPRHDAGHRRDGRLRRHPGAAAAASGSTRCWPAPAPAAGLRLAVVGYEREVTAEAGHRVGLSAGAKVVHVSAGTLDTGRRFRPSRPPAPTSCCWSAAPTAATPRCCCTTPAGSARPGLAAAIVLAGNVEARDEALAELASRGRKVVATDNVLPAIGVLEPRPARSAIRDVFIRHVIGGKGLSRGKDFAAMVRAATPDVGAGRRRGARRRRTGGRRHGSRRRPRRRHRRRHDRRLLGRSRPRARTPGCARRSSRRCGGPARSRATSGCGGTPRASWRRRGRAPADAARRRRPGSRRTPSSRPTRRTCRRPGRRRTGSTCGWPSSPRRSPCADTAGAPRAPRPLRDVGLVVGSGGVLRHHDRGATVAVVLAPPQRATTPAAGGCRSAARVVVDRRYVLFAAGLLAQERPRAASRLVGQALRG